MMICNLCHKKVEKFVDSHIIPRSFYKSLDKNNKLNKPFLLMANTPGVYKTKSPIGIYDQIICEKCERSFSAFDLHAKKILLSRSNFSPYNKDGDVLAWSCHYNYLLLKKFFLSLLWRASITRHSFFKMIELGPHLSRVEAFITGESIPTEQDYSVILAKFDDKLGQQIIMNPHPENRKVFENRFFYRFYLGSGYIAYIKVDKRPLVGIFTDIVLHPERKLTILNRGSFQESSDMLVIKEILEKNKTS